jgi:hypothetical protein
MLPTTTNHGKNCCTLRAILGLGNTAVDLLHREAYRAVVKATLADGTLTDEKTNHLTRWRERWGVSDATHQEVYRDEAYPVFRRCFDQVTATGLLSPEDDAILKRVADGLGVTVLHNAETHRRLDQMRYYWQIEYGSIPHVHTNLNLGRNEVCYWSGRAEALTCTTRAHWLFGSDGKRPHYERRVLAHCQLPADPACVTNCDRGPGDFDYY